MRKLLRVLRLWVSALFGPALPVQADPVGLGDSDEWFVTEVEMIAFETDLSYLSVLAIVNAKEGI